MSDKHKNTLEHVFGPVPSRRLGRSLGIDLIPLKTCTLDCIYCQIGKTTSKTTKRGEFVPLETVVAEIDQALETSTKPDYITLAGSGEPTLYSRLGELIDRIHRITDIPVDILTNGVLLADPQVRQEVSKADLIVPSLDAGDPEMFRQINRPAEGIEFDNYIRGLRTLCKTHGSKVWLEVFFIKNMNETDEHAAKIASIANDLGVARIQLNTAVRPASESYVSNVSPHRLTQLAEFFDPKGEIIADFPEHAFTGEYQAGADNILDTLKRRPCTLDDLVSGLDIQPAETAKIIEKLLQTDKIKQQKRNNKTYYLAK